MPEVLQNIIKRVKDYQQEARFATENDDLRISPGARQNLLDSLLDDLTKMEEVLNEFWEKFDEQFLAI